MEITISEVGESSCANYPSAPYNTMEMPIYEEGEFCLNDPEPIPEFTVEERNIIKEQLMIYAGEAEKLEKEAHRGSTSCIYRVLPRIKEINGNRSYEPNMVCIGPYYYKRREEKFQMAENCKRKCFGSLLVKTTDQEMQINTYMKCLQRISKLEEEIKKCYSEEFEVAGIEFLEMMVVDACFIIEIIARFGPERLKVDPSESLEALAWMVPYFYRDFLLLENQIPFFVLEEIYAITRGIRSVESCRDDLIYAALGFFKNGLKRFSFIMKTEGQMKLSPKHLLDLVLNSLLPFDSLRRVDTMSNLKLVWNRLIQRHEQQKPEFPTKTPFIHCVSKLRLAGIKVSPVKALSFLEVKFENGVIKMPNIAINDLIRCLFLNCVAFEQCYKGTRKYFTVYATFLDCLVNTSEDVEYLRERNVIDNYLTNDSEVADFINLAGKDLILNDNDVFYLGKLFEDVDMHYRNKLKWKWASFEREYFDKPWLLLSAAGGILLVVATSIQAAMAILTYKYKNC